MRQKWESVLDFREQTKLLVRSLKNKQEGKRSLLVSSLGSVSLVTASVLGLQHRTQQRRPGDMWHVLSLPGLGTVNNWANRTDRTLLAPSVSVLLYGLSCCFLSLNASWRHPLGLTVGRRVHILPWESVSQDPTLQKERVDACAPNKEEQVVVYLLLGFEKVNSNSPDMSFLKTWSQWFRTQ